MSGSTITASIPIGQLNFSDNSILTWSASTGIEASSNSSYVYVGSLMSIAGGSFSAGISNIGNTGGSSGVTATRLVFVGSNNITLSQTTDTGGGTVAIYGAAAGAGNISISGGVSSGTYDRIVFSNSNNISFGLNGSTINR